MEVIAPSEAARIRAACPDRILQMRHMFTDKNDGKRTATNPLPIKADDRLIVPGFKDPDLVDLRRNAPTACRRMPAWSASTILDCLCQKVQALPDLVIGYLGGVSQGGQTR